MKPIPPGYSEAADNAPIPGRPWWHVKYGGVARASIPPQHAVSGFCRSDGAFVPHETWQVRGESLDFPDSVAAYDAAHPLPHPGYRAGQVWLHANGKTTTVLQVTDDGRPWGLIPGFPWGSSVPMVGELHLAACFLLHDPLMPCATWDPWCGSTDQGFYDGGPAYWQGIGWVSADEAPLPHVDVVGWFAREDVRIVQHDGRDWTGPAPLFWCALPPDPA